MLGQKGALAQRCASRQNTKCHTDDAVGARGKEEKKSQLLSQVPTQLEEPEVLKLEVHPVEVKEPAAPPEVMEENAINVQWRKAQKYMTQ